MRTFNVYQTSRNENNNRPIETKIVGTVTAYTFTSAMRKAADKFNNSNWANISVELKK